MQLVTISYKEKGRVPVVAHVPTHPITFREFRKYLGVSSKSSLQLVLCKIVNTLFQIREIWQSPVFLLDCVFFL